ncbi:hypothetical protein C7A11_15020 [Pseudomonas simiae]|nr:hypothetical protein C7A11_15020 [Pseudomonas simiae]
MGAGLPAIASTRCIRHSEVSASQASQLPLLISFVWEDYFQAKKMPRTWRGIFLGEAYRPSSIALLRTAPLSALVASRA